MNNTQYQSIVDNIDRELSILLLDYSKGERKWNLDTEELILERQAKIRNLKRKKLIAWEEYLVTSGEPFLPVLQEMLKPIVTRRLWREFGNPRNDVNSPQRKQTLLPDGERFTFEAAIESFQPKHTKGFWSCHACLEDLEKVQIFQGDFQIYTKRLSWCPQFVQALAQNKTPDAYYDALQKISPEVPFCFAGLLHTEFQTTDTEAKLVQKCDTCGFTKIESKELATPIDPENFEVGIDLGENADKAEVKCVCKICNEVVFEAPVSEATNREGLTKQYEELLDKHYRDKHGENL
jgi:hypothetical protein